MFKDFFCRMEKEYSDEMLGKLLDTSTIIIPFCEPEDEELGAHSMNLEDRIEHEKRVQLCLQKEIIME